MSDQTLYRRQSCDCPQIGGPDCRAGYVPVWQVCIVHWQPPIDERGFCPRGTEYDNGEWWEFDCDVREVTDDE